MSEELEYLAKAINDRAPGACCLIALTGTVAKELLAVVQAAEGITNLESGWYRQMTNGDVAIDRARWSSIEEALDNMKRKIREQM